MAPELVLELHRYLCRLPGVADPRRGRRGRRRGVVGTRTGRCARRSRKAGDAHVLPHTLRTTHNAPHLPRPTCIADPPHI